MSATAELVQEHEVIQRMLAVIQAAQRQVAGGGKLPAGFISAVVDFIRNFADRCHHGKEEDNLFPAMEKRGIPRQGGPIGVMLAEHDQGRAYVKKMDEAGKRLADGDQSALQDALANALGYVELLTQHIDKENNILYPLADQVLTAEDQRNLVSRFAQVERERIGAGGHEAYLKMVDRLELEVGIR